MVYGVFHLWSLRNAKAKHEREEAWKRKLNLIARAKEAYQLHRAPKSSSPQVFNPEDPNFDLEKYIAALEQKPSA